MVEIEADLSVFPSVLCGDADGHLLAKAFKYLGHGDLIFSRQGLGERILQDVLDAIELSPVICEAIVVLYNAIDAAVQTHDVLRTQERPSLFVYRFAFFCATYPVS